MKAPPNVAKLSPWHPCLRKLRSNHEIPHPLSPIARKTSLLPPNLLRQTMRPHSHINIIHLIPIRQKVPHFAIPFIPALLIFCFPLTSPTSLLLALLLPRLSLGGDGALRSLGAQIRSGDGGRSLGWASWWENVGRCGSGCDDAVYDFILDSETVILLLIVSYAVFAPRSESSHRLPAPHKQLNIPSLPPSMYHQPRRAQLMRSCPYLLGRRVSHRSRSLLYQHPLIRLYH